MVPMLACFIWGILVYNSMHQYHLYLDDELHQMLMRHVKQFPTVNRAKVVKHALRLYLDCQDLPEPTQISKLTVEPQ